MNTEMVTPYITKEQLDRVFDVKPTHEGAFDLDPVGAMENAIYSYRHSNLARCHFHLVQREQALQAKIDALMFEYCPDEMTPEQIDNWGKHQRVVSPDKANSINKALGIDK